MIETAWRWGRERAASALAALLLAGMPVADLVAAPVAVPAGGRALVELRREGVVLSDAAGQVLQTHRVRAKRLQQRALASGATLAVALDADEAQPVVLAAEGARLTLWAGAPRSRLRIETLCLQLDRQGLPHLWLIAEDGRAEQWLLRPEGALLEREAALTPGASDCVADDARQRLYLAEPALGVWAHDVGGEGDITRQPLALRAPWGRLGFAPQRLALGPQGLRVEGERQAGQRVPRQWLKLAPAAAAPALPVVHPVAQTDPVARLGDAADDPAIWVHPRQPEHSRVLATNKKQGLLVYDLDGRERQLLSAGRLNNVDVRQRIRMPAGAQPAWRDLAVATQRDERALVLFDIAGDGTVSELTRLPTGLDEVYGVCAARTPDGELDVYVNDKDGRFRHLRLEAAVDADGTQRWRATLRRSFRLASQPEGCVVDERAQRLFVGEEDRGIWVLSSRADQPAQPQLVLATGGVLQADVEGLALYHGPEHSWLVASSQGNDSYVVLEARPPWRVRGAFRIGLDATRAIDAASETDGLEVVSSPLGPRFAQGLLVVQDGHKQLPGGAQNFKYVDWRDVVKALGLEP